MVCTLHKGRRLLFLFGHGFYQNLLKQIDEKTDCALFMFLVKLNSLNMVNLTEDIFSVSKGILLMENQESLYFRNYCLFYVVRFDYTTDLSSVMWPFLRKSVKRQCSNVRSLDFKPRNTIRYFFNRIRYNAQEARQLEYVGILDGVLDFSYQQLLCKAVNSRRSITNNRVLYNEVKTHFARYPTNFELWLFLDNHDLNRFLFECDGDKSLLREAIKFSGQWEQPWIMFYGTEKSLLTLNQLTMALLTQMKG